MSRLNITERVQISGADLNIPYVEQIGFDNFTAALPLLEHKHRGFEITYVEAGNAVWELGDGTSLTLKGHDMALTQPDMLHQGEFDSISPASIFWVSFVFDESLDYRHFSTAEVTNLKLHYESLGNSVYFAGERLPVMIDNLYETLQNFDPEDELFVTLARVQINSLLLVILREMDARKKRHSSDYTSQAQAYIQKNLGHDMSVGDIAGYLGISESFLYELFRKELGVTPAHHVQHLRLESAKDALRLGKKNITDIAFSLGFNSSQYFASCFKKHTGLTPRQYQRQYR